MIVLDAYAVLAFLEDEPAANEVAMLLRGDDDACLTALGVAEVLDHLVRVAQAEPDEAALDLAQLRLAQAIEVDSVTAVRAGLLRARQYHRRDRAVSLADCVVAEAARDAGCAVATSDPHLLDLCDAEGIDVIALPGTNGSRWRPLAR